MIKKLVWLSRPGVASIFTPNLGAAQECKTSIADTKARIWVWIGKITLLSTSKSRNPSLFITLELIK